MSLAGKICVRPMADLLCQELSNKSEKSEFSKSPQQKKKRRSLQNKTSDAESPEKVKAARKRVQRKAATTSKKVKEQNTEAPRTVKKSQTTKKLFKKDENQKTIDSFFKSASKNYNIAPRSSKELESAIKCKPKIKKSRRKIVYNDKDKSDTSVSNEHKYQVTSIRKTNKAPIDVIDLLDSEDEQKEAAVVENNKTNAKASKKICRKILESSSSEKSERVATKANASFSHNHENDETKSIDEVIPASQDNGTIVGRKCRRNISFELTSTKKTKHVVKSLPEPIVERTADENAVESQNKLLSSSTVQELHVNIVKEAITTVFEDSPPTTSTSKAVSYSTSLTRNDKENCVPKKSTRESFSLLEETSKSNSAAINETSLVTTTGKEDVIVDISDDDFEYVQPKTKIQRKLNNSRKTRSRTKNVEPQVKKSKKIPPPYKIIEGTNGTMAVDAFNFGDIEGVTHYFLTHFHADHYIGLTRKFSHPCYMSSITARLVRAFIPIEEKYIKELELNTPIKIGDIEVTAIDANHCPGAVMLIFKLTDGRCILHTGDFRANADMESEPIFWNNDIHTIYLDTTYISQNYAFCHQSESIARAKQIMKEFIERNVGTRILFVCGAYLIGKEKFWSALASEFKFKVYTEGNRKKALTALQDETLNAQLTESAYNAQMHVIPLQKLSYNSLLEYFDQYAEYYDLLFALRPSGWEKNSKPQYRGKINIIGIEYSEHSSHDEMKRFVQYLKPQNVISTVPVNSNAMITAKVPQKWYKYTTLQRQYQPSITSFFKSKPNKYFRQLTKNHTTISTNNSILTKTQCEQTKIHETSMLVSSDSPKKSIVMEHAFDHNLKPKEELLAKVPNVTEPIVIDCDTDDDWLT